MSRIWLYKIFTFLLIITSLLSVSSKQVSAQSCGSGSTSFVQGCDASNGCSEIIGTMNYTCFGSSCTGLVSDNYCSTAGGGCTFVQGTFISIPCGGAAPGECPASCDRADYGPGSTSGCGAGSKPSAACKPYPCGKDQFGNQKACCEPTSCELPCTNTAPSTPILYAPPNGTTLGTVNTTLTWNAVTSWGNSCSVNVLAYDVFVGTDINNLSVYTSVGAGTTNVSFTGSWGNTYYWKVRAKNGAMQTDSSVWSFTIPACGGVTAPNSPTVTNLSYTSATLNWINGSGGVSRLLRVDPSYSAVDSGCPNGQYNPITNPTGCTVKTDLNYSSNITTYPLTNLTPGTTYFWRVAEFKSGTEWKDFGNQCIVSNHEFFTTPLPPNGPWWQVKDGDITTTGSISSDVFINDFLDTDGIGGFPGVPVYAGSLSTFNGRLSSKSWQANTSTTESRKFDYSYFNNLIPPNVILNDVSLLATGGVADSEGYEWFKTTGHLFVSNPIDFGSRKVILFVESGNLRINSTINLTDGQGFFGAFVTGNIIVAPSVNAGSNPDIEGLYLTNNYFDSGAGTTQLHIRGSVAAYDATDGIRLQRDLPIDTQPAELFEFAPDQIALFPEKLGFRRTRWSEVAP